MSDDYFTGHTDNYESEDTEVLSDASDILPLEPADDMSKRDDVVRETLLRIGPAVVRPSCIFALMEVNPRDVEAVLEIIKRSPGLTARVLSVINSAAFGMARQITSIDRAVHLLGSTRARAIALAYGLRIITERSGLPREATDLIWANSLQKAIAARMFCEVADPQYAESAYSLGLIQDIGLSMLMAVDPEYYEQNVITGAARNAWSERERVRFGFDHAAIGQGLLAEWKASKALQTSVLHHHRPPMDKLSDDTSILDLAVFFASLLPHMQEEPTAEAIEWIQAIHIRFLAKEYASPDAFLKAVMEEVKKIRSTDDHVAVTEQFIKKLVNVVTASTVAITAKLCRLEQDIDQQRQGINDLKFQAFTDPLTKVLNRRGFTQLARRRLEFAEEQEQGLCIMLGDLDDFKAINDTYGHDVGDMVLRGLARVMRRNIGRNDLIGRLGGDEFAILITGVSREEADRIAQRITDSIEGKSLRVRDDLNIEAHFSLGAVYCEPDQDELTVDTLLNLADRAMYQRKRNGKNGLTFTTFNEAKEQPPTPASHPAARKGHRSA